MPTCMREGCQNIEKKSFMNCPLNKFSDGSVKSIIISMVENLGTWNVV